MKLSRAQARWNRWRATTWMVHHPGTYPNFAVTVDINSRGEGVSGIAITCYPGDKTGTAFCLTRREAATLARRITDCLEATA